MKRSNNGRSARDREEYDTYMKMDVPFSMVTNSDIPLPLPNPFGGCIYNLQCTRLRLCRPNILKTFGISVKFSLTPHHVQTP